MESTPLFYHTWDLKKERLDYLVQYTHSTSVNFLQCEELGQVLLIKNNNKKTPSILNKDAILPAFKLTHTL